ncbi:MAG TPA: hypothetical protein VNU49_10550 [Opitutaceae bacterium]|jgi:hypothetical protein|nr:hypothetical protein [Opitutaceae bacterium]
MKALAVLLLLAAPVLAHANDIHPGDSLATVEATLGAPRSQMQLGDKLVLIYDRGQVRLVNGKVVSTSFLSSEDLAAQQAQQKAADDQAAQLRDQRIAEGQALKAHVLADPRFVYAPLTAQLAFWQKFHLRYPEVSCEDEYKMALARQQQFATQPANPGNTGDPTRNNWPMPLPDYYKHMTIAQLYKYTYDMNHHQNYDHWAATQQPGSPPASNPNGQNSAPSNNDPIEPSSNPPQP